MTAFLFVLILTYYWVLKAHQIVFQCLTTEKNFSRQAAKNAKKTTRHNTLYLHYFPLRALRLCASAPLREHYACTLKITALAWNKEHRIIFHFHSTEKQFVSPRRKERRENSKTQIFVSLLFPFASVAPLREN